MKARRLVAVLAVLVAPAAPLGAQGSVIPPAPGWDKHGCTGFGYDVKLFAPTRSVLSMVLARVDTAGPAGLAGLRSGDTVVVINGVHVQDGGIGKHWNTPPGTKHTLRVRRPDGERDVTFVSGTLEPAGADSARPRACLPAKPGGG